MRWLLLLLLLASPVSAQTVVATRTIRAQAVLTAADVAIVPGVMAGAFASPEQAIGLEARVVLYAGRPIRTGDIGPPAIVQRNQPVTLRYDTSALSIVAEGRALMRGGVGDTIRVLNIASRLTVQGQVRPDGSIDVLAVQ